MLCGQTRILERAYLFIKIKYVVGTNIRFSLIVKDLTATLNLFQFRCYQGVFLSFHFFYHYCNKNVPRISSCWSSVSMHMSKVCANWWQFLCLPIILYEIKGQVVAFHPGEASWEQPIRFTSHSLGFLAFELQPRQTSCGIFLERPGGSITEAEIMSV